MSDAIQAFDKALKDRVVDRDDLNSLLSDLTVEDWQKIAEKHPKGNNLHLTGFGRFDSDFWVEEKDDQFVVHNAKDALQDRKLLDGLKGFGIGVGTVAVVSAIGWQIGNRMSNPWVKLGGIALGIAAGKMVGGSLIKGVDEAAKNADPLVIPKDSLRQEKVAMLDRSANLSEMLLARSRQTRSLSTLIEKV